MSMNKITENLWMGDEEEVWGDLDNPFDRMIGYVGNSSYDLFERETDSVVRALERGETVLVACDMSESRSAMVSTAALATIRGESFNEAWSVVKDKCGVVPSDETRRHAKVYAGENGGGKRYRDTTNGSEQ